GGPRRCGCFRGVAARYSARINGITAAALTRLDVLDALPSIKVCTGYELDGRVLDTMPASSTAMARVQPVYEQLSGWRKDTSGCRRFDDLPSEARSYVEYIESILGA